jgi:hypothetical protein
MRAFDRLGMDVAAFAIIAVQMNPAVSGITIHEWLGVLLIVPLAIHLVLNWSWTVTAIDRFLGKIRPTMRSNLIIDTGLFLSMVAVGLSGVLLIPGFAASVGIPVSPLWHAVHLVTANLTLAFFCAHLALHARWMLNTVRRAFETKPRAPVPARPRPPAAAARPSPERTRTTGSTAVTTSRGA